MSQIYDGQKHVALTAEKDRLEKEIHDVSVRMNEEHASDAWEGEDAPAKMARYNADNIRHAQLSRELDAVSRQVNHMEGIRPLSKAERNNPMRNVTYRWFKGGEALLDEGERQTFTEATTPEAENIINALGGSKKNGVEGFNPWAIATEGGTVPMPSPRMAAGDPSRSDISTANDGTALGSAAPETWATGVVEHLKYFGSVASSCHNFDTMDGNDWHQNTLDTADEEGGTMLDQSQTAGTGVPPTQHDTIGNAGDIIFKSMWRHSNFIDARLETLNDIHFDVAGRIMREMSRRMGRGWNNTFTKGVTNGAQGIVPSATEVAGGGKSAIASDGGIDYQNLLDMEYSIDLAYLTGDEGGMGAFMDAHGGMIGWMMNRNVEKSLRFATLIGAHGSAQSGLPIWVPVPTDVGVATQRPPALILGWPYSINQAMDDGTTNNDKPLLFGACGHYAVRNIGGPTYYRFWDTTTAKRMAVSFLGMSRRDGRCRGPGTISNGVASACEAYAALKVSTAS